ncbi:MAG TPA: hypothetical protein VF167_05780 [Longimicrobiaceae bacterium]
MRITPTLAALPLLLGACASASNIPQADTERSIVSVQTSPATMGEAMELTRDANIHSAALAADAEKAWTELPAVFQELALGVTAVDGNVRALSSVQRVRRIGGKGPGSFFRCAGPYGNLASSGDVYLSLQAQILPAQGGSGSVLRTRVEATARAATGATQVQCSSNGSLQKLITDTLKKRLGEA